MDGYLRAVVTTRRLNPDLVRRIAVFRKRLFVDTLRWDLPSADGAEELDQFDRDDTVYAALCDGASVVGCFRAIRADRPYLTQSLFPELASDEGYPRATNVWEISRFGVAAGAGLQVARANYALMFSFAQSRDAEALVALVDLTYERFLRRIGIVSRRYGVPTIIGKDLDGRPIQAVAGEIPINAQCGPAFASLLELGRSMETVDETLVRGRIKLSA